MATVQGYIVCYHERITIASSWVCMSFLWYLVTFFHHMQPVLLPGWEKVYFRGGLWGMAFGGQYLISQATPFTAKGVACETRRKELPIPKKRMHMTSIWNLSSTIHMSKMSWKRLLKRLLLYMRREEQEKYKQWRWTHFSECTAFVYQSLLCMCTNRRGYLPLGVLLSTQSN